MPDKIVQVGAVFNGAEYKAGMEEAVALTKESMESINTALNSVSGGFSALGAALGASVFTEFVNHVKDQVLEVSHLSDATGISVVKITELKDAFAEAGVSADRLPMQLTKMARSMEMASQGIAQQSDAFRALGIDTSSWADKMPSTIDVLEQIATHLQHSTNNTRDLANMSAIFGRGVVGLTAFLKEHGDKLDEVTRKYVEHGIEVEKSADAAKHLQQAEAQLKADLETQLLPTFRLVVDAIDGMRIMYEAAGIYVKAFGAESLTVAGAVLDSFKAMGVVINDAVTGNFKAIPNDVHNSLLILQADVEAFNQIQEDGAIELRNRITDILAKPVVPEKGGDDGTGNQTEADLKKSIAANVAKIDADQKTQDAIVTHHREALSELVAADQVSAEDALTLNKYLLDQKFKQDTAALQAKIAQYNRDPDRDTAKVNAALGEIQTLKVQHNTVMEKLDADYYKEVEKNGKEAVAKAAERNNKFLTDFRGGLEARMKAVKEESDNEVQIEELEVENKFNQGKISRQQEIAQMAALKIEELNVDIRYLQNRQQLYLKGSKEYEQIEAAITKDKQQQVLVRKKADDDEANNFTAQIKRQLKEWQNLNQQLSQSFMQTMGSFNSSLSSFIVEGQANWKQFAASAIESIISVGLQYVESKLLMMIMDKLGMKTKLETDAETGMSEVEIAANVGAANAYAAFADMPAIAAGMSAAAFGVISGFSAPIAAVASLDVGTNYVPQDGLAYLHKGEEVIPANKRGSGWTGDGGSGITVHVHNNVSAIDAESFGKHIDRHSNMIGEKVVRVLKRKGFK